MKIELTTKQANLLQCYILMTTKYREGEAKTYRELAQEVDKDGNPVFPNAASNAEFWEELSPRLDEIYKIIESAEWRD